MANIMPPYPRQVSVNRAVPYGGASWDIVSWEELQALDSQLSAAVW
jgi:hypothetical protein